MVPVGNKAKRLSSVSYTTKAIHHHANKRTNLWVCDKGQIQVDYILLNETSKKFAAVETFAKINLISKSRLFNSSH